MSIPMVRLRLAVSLGITGSLKRASTSIRSPKK